MNQEVIPNSYWQAVKDRMGELAAMPGQAIRGAMGDTARGAVMNPNARTGVPQEALPGGAPGSIGAVGTPQQQQALVEALMRKQQEEQMQQQMLEQQRMMQQQQQNPGNPAGIQF